MEELLGVDDLLDLQDLGKLLTRLGLDLVFATIVIRLVYYRKYRSHDFLLTFYLFNIITLSLCLLLRKVPAELGFALTLFSVFGILRYRTEQIHSRDLTYLFIVIGLGIVNGVANKKVSAAELLVFNALVAAVTAYLEMGPRGGAQRALPLLYDRIDLLQPGQDEALHADLAKRLGVQPIHVEIQRIDLLRDAAEITVYVKGATPRRTSQYR